MSPRPGALLCPPVPRGPRTPAGRTPKVKNVFRFKLDAKSIPEALATTILILLQFSIVLAHRQNPGASAPPRALGDASSAPLGTPGPPPQKKSRVWVWGLMGVYGGSMGCGWGADEAGLRARGGPMTRGFVDALDR